MRRFIYFESTEGGMETHFVNGFDDLHFLNGWMLDYLADEDEALVEWMQSAKVGEYHDHRLGTMVRITDDEGDES